VQALIANLPEKFRSIFELKRFIAPLSDDPLISLPVVAV
jgi:hypothetical protein